MTITVFHWRDFLESFLAGTLEPLPGWTKEKSDANFGLCYRFYRWAMRSAAYDYVGKRLAANGHTTVCEDGSVTCMCYPFGLKGGDQNPYRREFATKELAWAKEMANYAEWLQKWEAKPPKRMGLCNGLWDYANGHNGRLHRSYANYRKTLKDRFIALGWDTETPFNPDVSAYNKESTAVECHLNLRRIAFVRSELEWLGL